MLRVWRPQFLRGDGLVLCRQGVFAQDLMVTLENRSELNEA